MVRRILHDLADEDVCVVASANGTFVDLIEKEAIKRELPGALVYSAKPALGESVGASALWQVIAGAQALRTKRLPQMPPSPQHVGLNFPTPGEIACAKAIILSCGLNQQVAGLRLRMDSRAPIVSGLSI
jgi:3-oxoacyl-(acyl-carrier-protein) synthase